MTTNSTSNFDKVSTKEKDREQMFLSMYYYRAVRDLTPVWKLEDMRLTEMYYWDRQHIRRIYSPSDALMYAIIHDHQAYAKYLLSHFSEEALTQTNNDRCSCPPVVPHLVLAVRYDRREIMYLLLQVVQRLPSLQANLKLPGCLNSDNCKSPLHVACELLQLETIAVLLGNGASAQVEDQHGATPVDVILEHLQNSKDNIATKRRCLDTLLVFMTEARCKMQGSLKNDPVRWSEVLGQDTFDYLVGKTPRTLVLIAMHSILRQLPTDNFLNRLNELPIPSLLKPVTLPGSG